MTRVVVLPHRVGEQAVQVGPWSIRVGDVEQPATARVVDWDRRSPLVVRSEMTIDPVLLREECGLDADAPIAVVSTWHASGTNVRRVGMRADVDERGTRAVGFAIDPAAADGSVRLVRAVVLSRDHESASASVASRAGSVLWRERTATATSIDLQSTAGAFDIDAIDFSELQAIDPESAWLLDVDFSDPYRAAPTSLRLVANTAHPAVADLLAAEEEGAPQRRLIESVLRWDVARTLIHRALEQQSFLDGYGDFSPESVGGAVQQLLQLHLPEADVDELALMRREAPGTLDALLQGRLRVLRST